MANRINLPEIGLKRIVIVGAGFAGLRLSMELKGKGYQIVLIDKNNYHQFQPLLYQVAMANLDASNISFPLRNIFKKSKNVRIRVAKVINIDSFKSIIETDSEIINYDYLVIATGAATNYYGNSAIEKFSFPMKSTLEALQIRNSLLELFEEAVTSEFNTTKTNISVVVVGGGPTGVELSGMLAEMKRDSLPFEYPELDFLKMDIHLLEGSSKLLPNMREESSIKSKAYLIQMGVKVKTNALVKEYDGKKILLSDGTSIESSLVIWAAGVKGNVPRGINPDFITKSNQIKTDIFNRVISTTNIFAIGDIASIETALLPKGFPQLASVAIDQAKNVADNFKLMAQKKELKPFQYVNKGNMATIGRNRAVVDLAKPQVSFSGWVAWLIWMSLHLFLLLGFKNKLIVFINWTYKYFTHHQSLSLLFVPLSRKNK